LERLAGLRVVQQQITDLISLLSHEVHDLIG
jgi:hypothetical protein